MKPIDENHDAVSALLAPLRDRTGDRLDDVAAARVLARAEAALSPSTFDGRASTVSARPWSRAIPRRWLVPATLMLWGALYVWAAAGEIRILYPRASAPAREVALSIAPAGWGSAVLPDN